MLSEARVTSAPIGWRDRIATANGAFDPIARRSMVSA